MKKSFVFKNNSNGTRNLVITTRKIRKRMEQGRKGRRIGKFLLGPISLKKGVGSVDKIGVGFVSSKNGEIGAVFFGHSKGGGGAMTGESKAVVVGRF